MMDRLDSILETIDAATDGAGANLCPQERFMVAMGKLLTVGAFYPAQHTRSQEVGCKIQVAMGDLDALQGPLRLETRTKGIQIQNKILNKEIPAIRQWHDLLQQLAVAAIEIAPDISSLNLHHLATGLLSLKLEADSALHFVSPDFSNLPPGITIIPRNFGRRKENEETAQKIMQTVEEALSKLGDGDSSSLEHQEYRELMELFFVTVVERLEKNKDAHGAQASNKQRPLDEVLQLGSHAIGHALQVLEDNQGELSQLPEIFENAEFALAYASDEKTVELMVDVLQQTVSDIIEESQQAKKPWVPDLTNYKLSLDQLQEKVQELEASQETYTDLRGGSQSEYISICLEILTAGISKQAFQRTTRDLAEILSGRMNEEEFDALVTGADNILKTTPITEIDQYLPYLISPIHRSDQDREARFWQELWTMGNAKTHIAMWPHIALLLFTENKSPVQANNWSHWVASLDTDEISRQLPRLEAMRSFQLKKINKTIFAQAPLMLHPVFGILMGSSMADDLGPLLHVGIANQTNQNLSKILMAACEKYDPAKRRLYQLLLAEAKSSSPSVELKEIAATTLHGFLNTLDKERLEEAWVGPAISAYGALAGSQGRPLLEKVVSEKRMKVFNFWPDTCRKSAKSALARLEGKTKGSRK